MPTPLAPTVEVSGTARRIQARDASEPSGGRVVSDVCEVTCINQDRVDRARRGLPAAATVQALAETFKALGDPTRLVIVTALAGEELCVCDLAALVGVSASAVSHSLRTLRQLRLVRYRKVGKVAYYSLDDAHVARLAKEAVRHAAERPSAR